MAQQVLRTRAHLQADEAHAVHLAQRQQGLEGQGAPPLVFVLRSAAPDQAYAPGGAFRCHAAFQQVTPARAQVVPRPQVGSPGVQLRAVDLQALRQAAHEHPVVAAGVARVVQARQHLGAAGQGAHQAFQGRRHAHHHLGSQGRQPGHEAAELDVVAVALFGQHQHPFSAQVLALPQGHGQHRLADAVGDIGRSQVQP
jgi:hypothetical protein